jgi:hypothetical protein
VDRGEGIVGRRCPAVPLAPDVAVFLRVAGFTLRVTCRETNLNVAPGRASSPFVVAPQPHDVSLEVVSRAIGNDGAGECLFDSGGPWRLYRHDDGFLFRFYSSTCESGPYKTALMSHDFSRGLITLHSPFFAGTETVDPLEYPLDELLIIGLLGRGRGVEIHGLGVLDRDSRGYLFVGQSGAGKSTLARLWLGTGGGAILSDDRIVLRGDGDELWMYGTPWHGEEPLASPSCARPAGIFFLRHAERHALAPLANADAVARLFAACFPPFHSADALGFTLEFLESVVAGIPCFELQFAPTSSAVDFLRGSV